MEKDFRSLLPQRQIDGQFLNDNPLTLPFDLGMRNTGVPCAIPCTDAVRTNDAQTALGFSGLHNIKPGQLKEPPGWFYCLPCFRQGFIPEMILSDQSMLKNNLTVKVPELTNDSRTEFFPTCGNGHGPKQFLVFDQTGNKTTMMFSSGIGTRIPGPSSWNRQPGGLCNVNVNERRSGGDKHHYLGPYLTDDLDDDYGIGEARDMHEDTEEINALLLSDDEDNSSEDGEETTSTGHSPSIVTVNEGRGCFDEEDTDEVCSSAGPVKRQKLSDSSDQITSVTYTGNSVKPTKATEYGDDAESSCVGGRPTRCSDSYPLSGSKRLRKEKIRETLSILQTMLPDVKGKDAVIILDEAINYLRTLKFKAKSLGLSGASQVHK